MIAKPRIATLFFLLFLCCQSADGRLLRVNKSGNDALAITNPAVDFLTIQAAVDFASSGDTILVFKGVYIQSIDLSAKSLVLMGTFSQTGDSTDLYGTVIEGGGASDHAVKLSGIAEVNGFVVRSGKLGGLLSNGPSILRNLIVQDNDGHGIQLTAPQYTRHLLEDIVVSGNKLNGVHQHLNVLFARNVYSHSNLGHGFNLMSGTDTLVNCVSINNQYGMFLLGSSVLSHCTVKSNIVRGLYVMYAMARVRNSIVWGNPQNLEVYEGRLVVETSIVEGGGSAVKIQHNDERCLTYSSTNITSDPRFVDDGRFTYRISAGSPAISKAHVDNMAMDDLFHNARPSPAGSRPDIGAHEHPTGTQLWKVSISDFSPTVARQGYTVTIRGMGLQGATGVSFGSKDALAFKVLSDSVIVATVPDGNSGAVRVHHPIESATKAGFIYSGPALPDLNHNRLIHVSTQGVDNGSTGLKTSPFRTIAAALRYSREGDTVVLLPGRYHEEVNTAAKKIVLGGTFMLDGDTSAISKTIIDGGFEGSSALLLQDGCELVGLTVTGGFPNGLEVKNYGGSFWRKHTLLSNLVVRDNLGQGVLVHSLSYSECRLSASRLASNGYNGLLDQSENMFLEKVLSSENRLAGFWMQSGIDTLTNCVSLNNRRGFFLNTKAFVNHATVANSSEYALISHIGQTKVRNSIFWNGTPTLQMSGGGFLDVASSVVQNGRQKASLDYTPETNLTYASSNLSVNPFRSGQDVKDLSLPDTSIAIGNGVPFDYVRDDYYGSARPNPNGSTPDIGAFESRLGVRTKPDCLSFASTYNPFPEPSVYTRSDSLKLDAGAGFGKYAWGNGDTGQSIFVKVTGTYRVTVTGASGCTASDSVFVQFPDTVGMHLSKVSATCDKIVDVPVKVTAFRNMISAQGSIYWNPGELRFESISSFGPPSLGLGEPNFGTTQANAGRISFSWNDAKVDGLTLSDSATLFILRFTVLGSAVRSIPVTAQSTPAQLEFIGVGPVRKSFTTTPGSVDVTCEFTIAGRVLTPGGQGVRMVTMALSGGNSIQTTTDTSGNYILKVLSGTYTLTPSKSFEQNKTNGVTTFDLALIQSHILQRRLLDAAYKVIAADADNSSTVTTADIIALRRFILATDTTLPGNRIWAFVDGGQTFANPSNPFPFNAYRTFTNLATDVTQTFRGIKIGDVNYDRNPMLDQAPSGDTLRLYTEWEEADDGSLLLRLKTRSISGLLGYQYSLQWDPYSLRFENIISNPTDVGIGSRWTKEGFLSLSWNDPGSRGISFSEGFLMLEARFQRVRPFDHASIRLSDAKLVSEAFNANLQSVGLKLQSAELKGGFGQSMMRVFPNPVGREVNIEWWNEKKGTVSIRIVDAAGREVYRHTGIYSEGLNSIRIEANTRLQAGGHVLQLEADGRRHVRLLVIGHRR